jgi:hypothetical protein
MVRKAKIEKLNNGDRRNSVTVFFIIEKRPIKMGPVSLVKT